MKTWMKSVAAIGCVTLSLQVLSGCAAAPPDENGTEDKAAVVAVPPAAILGAFLVATGIVVWSAQQNRFETDAGWREFDWMADLLTTLVGWAIADGDTRSPEEIVMQSDADDWREADIYQPNHDLSPEELDDIGSGARQAATSEAGRGGPDQTCHGAMTMGLVRVTEDSVSFYAQSLDPARANAMAEAMCLRTASYFKSTTHCDPFPYEAPPGSCPDAAWFRVNLGDQFHVFP